MALVALGIVAVMCYVVVDGLSATKPPAAPRVATDEAVGVQISLDPEAPEGRQGQNEEDPQLVSERLLATLHQRCAMLWHDLLCPPLRWTK